MDIAAWLRGLGIAQYEASLRDNAFDGAVLRRLTGDDLREIGVTKVGDRRKLLDAIATLNRSTSNRPRLQRRRGLARLLKQLPLHLYSWM